MIADAADGADGIFESTYPDDPAAGARSSRLNVISMPSARRKFCASAASERAGTLGQQVPSLEIPVTAVSRAGPQEVGGRSLTSCAQP
jgi:hypothetical protein